MYKIAIVGGSGFIGKSLAVRLAEKFRVKILDTKAVPANSKQNTKYVYCDVRNYRSIAKQLDDVNLVIHAAIVQIPLINEKKSMGYEVNVLGTQNLCRAIRKSPSVMGMILAGSWHTFGEKELKGVIDEGFGLRPDKVEDRARLYVLSKIAQESIIRFYDEMSDKIFGIIRMGTVLGEGMPEKTAASIFIDNGLKGEPITPYRHSMYRPMLYVDIEDICKAYEVYSKKILCDRVERTGDSLTHIVNICYPDPITVLELAKIVQASIEECTAGRMKPNIEIIDSGIPRLFTKADKSQVRMNLEKAKRLLGLSTFKSPKESVKEIVQERVQRSGFYVTKAN